MTKLINKGGFRERANRTSKYHTSENEQAQLSPRGYSRAASAKDPSVKAEQVDAQVSHILVHGQTNR